MRTKVLIFVFLFLLPGCAARFDRHKFIRVKQAARSVEDAAAVSDYMKFGESLQNLSAEIAAIKDLIRSEEERQVFRAYTELLVTYEDAHMLWHYRLESSLYPWMPPGRIYADEKIKAIALKYDLPAEEHYIEITGRRFETVPSDSVRKIMEKARLQNKIITNRMPLF